MNQTTGVVLIIGLAVVLAISWMFFRRKRSNDLRAHFGPEYDRLIHEKGSQGRAETELGKREQRVKKFSIRPLPREVSDRFAKMWNDQQTRFIDEPKAAVVEADHLVAEVMKERGYPVGEFDQRAADISVDHPRLVENYRAAHEITLREQRGLASTEDLRAAMIYYRDLFRELLEDLEPVGATSR
jgi:LPXTG-motif cell wall-anchored protein